ncbi:MAG: hypothetical protein K2O40_15075 [Lachnospiraceae bacterium]|nr:hypothetical protein [Lachnospiraceae bacterium]
MEKKLDIRIGPVWEKDSIGCIDYELISPDVKATPEKPMLCRYDEAFGGLCPFPDMENLVLQDEQGILDYEEKEIPSFNSGIKCFGYFPKREVKGILRWNYRAFPRVLPENYRSSPYYDFRAEPGGLNGSGFFSLLLPVTDEELEVSLHWDMSRMPEGSRGIFSFGEGDVEKTMTVIELGMSLFTVGKVYAVENESFGVYYLSEPEFEIRPIVERIIPIFQYEKEYFCDFDADFKVFLRRDPFIISNGGSACRYAFISGYSAFGGFDIDKWFNTLLHEMTHTWPYMDDNNVGEGTWFTEGATEYYCTWLPYIGGFLDDEFTVKCLNEKIGRRYYRNPFREMPNMELPEIQWKERAAQECPYGRGFLYLANTQAQLRRAGKGSIDDVVKQFGWERPMHPEDWKAFLLERLGEEAVTQFEEMTKGKLLEPDADIFENRFKVIKDEIELNGEKTIAYHFEIK